VITYIKGFVCELVVEYEKMRGVGRKIGGGETHKKGDFPSFKLFSALLDSIVNNRKLYNSTRNIN